MPQMPKVELYAAIRRDHRDDMKLREIARKYNVSWRTIRKAVDSAWPEPRKKLPPRATALDPYKAVVDGILRADLDAPRKQRHALDSGSKSGDGRARRGRPGGLLRRPGRPQLRVGRAGRLQPRLGLGLALLLAPLLLLLVAVPAAAARAAGPLLPSLGAVLQGVPVL
ncbi:hypothetical protein [Kitasatospora sp. NPDC058190]|uniref:hypothetical protein n=1 Tax=Kitasatospora sp. NPDC058190 TaxID=3346371 RepID=UPI0036DC36B4